MIDIFPIARGSLVYLTTVSAVKMHSRHRCIRDQAAPAKKTTDLLFYAVRGLVTK